MKFYTDGGMGGRVNEEYSNQRPTLIEAVPLSDFLSSDVDFLKLDIEGAEADIIRHCSRQLGQVENIFFEYHNRIGKKQTLHELLGIIQEQGFLYYIKESAKRPQPFVKAGVICEAFDMALNIFCYKKGVNS